MRTQEVLYTQSLRNVAPSPSRCYLLEHEVAVNNEMQRLQQRRFATVCQECPRGLGVVVSGTRTVVKTGGDKIRRMIGTPECPKPTGVAP